MSDERSINWFQINFHFQELPNCYYNVIVDDDDYIYYSKNINSNNYYNYDYCKAFKYNIKLIQFDGEIIKLIHEEKFDFKKHNFNIILKSNDYKEIQIWKYYLLLVQLKLDVKINIILNDVSQDDGDYVEISKTAYNHYLNISDKPLTDDYSSITIISTLFNVIDDNSEIINHPWLRS